MSSQYCHEPPTYGKVILLTTVGDIEIELWSKEAPLACRNFIQLCMEGYYNNTIFHRVVRDFIIQGGDPLGTGKGGESIWGKPFKDEFHQRLRFNRRGLLGMANAGPNDNGSQFFITIGTEGNPNLNKKHTLFGKVVGPTVYNMLNIANCDIGEDERPKTINKILGAKIVNNPYDDIKPREPKKKEKKKDKKKEEKKVETKKLNLLSFGDEAEEDEVELEEVNKKLNPKGKSAHDVLHDEKLSTQVAVTRDEFEDYEPDANEDSSHVSESLDKIRAKFAKRKQQSEAADEPEEDDKEIDYDKMKADQRKEDELVRISEMQSELKSIQKEYLKAIRGPKEKKASQVEQQSDAMQKYSALKFKFKNQIKDFVEFKDPKREERIGGPHVEKFLAKLQETSQAELLKVKPVPPKKKKVEVVVETENEGETREFGVDLEVEDLPGSDWRTKKDSFFVAEDDDPTVTKAKDANMKDKNEDWYNIEDPRNAINKRRRGEE